jgi:hypothetical protein
VMVGGKGEDVGLVGGWGLGLGWLGLTHATEAVAELANGLG